MAVWSTREEEDAGAVDDFPGLDELKDEHVDDVKANVWKICFSATASSRISASGWRR